MIKHLHDSNLLQLKLRDNVPSDTFKLINATSDAFDSNSDLLHMNDHYNDSILFAGQSIDNNG